MGPAKKKWTPEEEAALKAGVLKHGHGKWCTILKDPQFGGVLYQRSNVNLKDKWRNMSMANGRGSGERARLPLKRRSPSPKLGENPLQFQFYFTITFFVVLLASAFLYHPPILCTNYYKQYSNITLDEKPLFPGPLPHPQLQIFKCEYKVEI